MTRARSNAMSSSVPLTPVPAPSTAPITALPLWASDIDTLAAIVLTALKDKDVSGVIAALPTVAADLYKMIVYFHNGGVSAMESTVVTVLDYAISKMPSISADDKADLTTLVHTIVPSMIALFPKIEAGVISGFQEAERETVTCFSAFCAMLKCKCGKQD